MLTRNATPTLARDTTLGLIGVAVNYYDSQGVMVSRKLGVKRLRELDGATICVQPGTVTELDLADWFRANSLSFKPVVIEKYDEIVRAFAAGRCDAFTSDKSQLAASHHAGAPADYQILDENIAKTPLGPMVRQGDESWFNIVRWSLNAMLEAEEFGIGSANVDRMLDSRNPNVQRILGAAPGMGRNLGVDDKWAYSIIKQVGNYGESYETWACPAPCGCRAAERTMARRRADVRLADTLMRCPAGAFKEDATPDRAYQAMAASIA